MLRVEADFGGSFVRVFRPSAGLLEHGWPVARERSISIKRYWGHHFEPVQVCSKLGWLFGFGGRGGEVGAGRADSEEFSEGDIRERDVEGNATAPLLRFRESTRLGGGMTGRAVSPALIALG